MIRILGSVPYKCVVAFSGGVDSVATIDFLAAGKRYLSLAYFNHGTEHSDKAETFVREFAERRGLPLTVGRISGTRHSGKSPEEFWRDERYTFLDRFADPVITAHHLDDAVETWIFSSLHGLSKLIPRQRGNVFRPFLTTPKSEFVDWCTRRGLTWCDDASNLDNRYMRNLIRNKIVPEALVVNPGLRTVIRKKYLSGE